MNYIGKFISNFKEFYNEINSATLTGAIDVIVIRQDDGRYLCSPFHVRFGKMGVLRSKEKIVDIEINGEPVDIHMKLGDNGEAFFVQEIIGSSDEGTLPTYLATSPIPCEILPEVLEHELKKLKIEQSEHEDDKQADNNQSETTCDTQVQQNEISSHNTQVSNSGEQQLLPEVAAECGQRKKKRRKMKKSQKSKDDVKEGELLHDDNLEYGLYDDEFQDDADESDTEKEPESETLKDEDNITRSSSMAIIAHRSNSLHPYSDGEMSPFNIGSPKFERPSSPKSDSEFEITRMPDDNDKQDEVSWQWGELPVCRKTNSFDKPLLSHSSSRVDQDDLVIFSDDESKGKVVIDRNAAESPPQQTDKQQRKLKLSVASESVEVAQDDKQLKEDAKCAKKDNSPVGIYLDDLNPEKLDPEVAELYFPKLRSPVPLRSITDDDIESGNGPSLPQSPHNSETISADSDSDPDVSRRNKRESGEVSHIDLKDIALSLCGGLQPQVDSEFAISADLFEHSRLSFDEFSMDPISIMENPNLVVRINEKYYCWKIAAPLLMSVLVYRRGLPTSILQSMVEQYQKRPKKKEQQQSRSWWSWRRSYNEAAATPAKTTEDGSKLEDEHGKPIDVQLGDSSDDELAEHTVKYPLGGVTTPPEEEILTTSQYRKVLRLPSECIKSLNLREGSNEAVFSVTTAYQGTTKCKCHVYLWNYDDKIIISDIDGTITKSDVLGHILPIIGKDWAQSGVANLFTKIKENGYKLLYLSARAIGQAKITREYLKSVRQGDLCLPDGPLLLSPTSLISAFHREVIEKKPEDFKISCLKDIQALFPSNPFYAGFGNKINDTWAYRAVGISLSRIFTINHRGELKLELIQTFQSSYTRLSDVVDQMFPPLEESNTQSELLSEFSTFNYWRDQLPEVSISIDTEKKDENETTTVTTAATTTTTKN